MFKEVLGCLLVLLLLVCMCVFWAHPVSGPEVGNWDDWDSEVQQNSDLVVLSANQSVNLLFCDLVTIVSATVAS